MENKKLGTATLTALLLGLAFFRYNLGWLVFVALLPLLHFLDLAKKLSWPTAKTLLYIWLTGLGFSLINLSWILSIKPDSWAAIGGVPALIGVIFCWLVMSLTFSAGWLVFGWLALKSRVDVLKISGFMLLPAAWVLGEYLRSWLFSVVMWGPGATLGPHWNLGSLGMAAAATPLVFAARLLGLFGLAFLTVMINLAIYNLLRRNFKVAAVGLGLAALIAILGYSIFPPKNTANLHIGLGQLVSEHDYFPTFAERLESVMSQETAPLDVLFMPEDALVNEFTAEQKSLIAHYAFKDGPGVIVSSVATTDRFNEIRYINERGEILNAQHKNFLIPVGEYLPAIVGGLLKITANSEEIDLYKEWRVGSKGETPEYPVTVNNVPISTLACSGIIAPEFYRRQALQGAQILANIASLNIFSNNQNYFEQVMMMARFQAVANAKPFVQSTISGNSLAYSGDGRLLSKADRHSIDFISLNITGSSRRTPYTGWGEVSILLSIIILSVNLFQLWKIKIQKI